MKSILEINLEGELDSTRLELFQKLLNLQPSTTRRGKTVISAELLADLLRRFVLLDDEAVVWSKEFPDRPLVDVDTTDDRSFSIQVVRDWLLVERALWVEAVVVASREDQEVEGPSLRQTFLVQGDGTAVWLDDPRAAAALGMRLHSGDLDVAAYAELLVRCQWPGGWHARPVLDPAAWRLEYPVEAVLPPVEPVRTWHEDGTLRIRFFASRESTLTVGGRPVLDVAAWSVRAPADQPATWEIRAVAEAIPLLPPW